MADKKADKKAVKATKEAVWNSYTKQEIAALEKLCTGYRDFLSNCKTERESTTEAVRAAKAAGYRDLAEVVAAGQSLKAGEDLILRLRGEYTVIGGQISRIALTQLG